MSDEQLLELVEWIVSDEFCEDIDMRLHVSETPPTEAEAREALDTAVKKLGLIYTHVHSHRKTAECYAAHDVWRAEAEAAYRAMQEERG